MPGEVDVDFVERFRQSIINEVGKGQKFLIIVGGGKISRWYQAALKELVSDQHDGALDWMGIAGTRINADLVRRAFGDQAYDQLVSDPTLDYEGLESAKVVIGFGWKPGWSTDYVATCFADKLQAKNIINLSNVDYVYTADPKIDPNAKKLDKITWGEYAELIPKDWKPGMSAPFDPVATKKAQEINIRLSFVAASNLDNLSSCVRGESFEGTVISS